MSANLDLYIDLTGATLRQAGSATAGVVPPLVKNDTYNIRLRLQENLGLNDFIDLEPSSYSAKVGIGFVNDTPNGGNFFLTRSGPVTSSAIPHNATTTQVLNAISGIAGNVTVATYGTTSSGWLITAATLNTALSFGGDSGTLFPTSSVVISNRKAYATTVCAQQIVQLKRNPAVFTDSFSSSVTTGQVTFSKIQDGGGSANETYSLLIGPDVSGGSVVFGFGGTNTTTAIPILAENTTYQEALGAVTGIGANNISVESGNSDNQKIVTFVRGLGQTNVATNLTIDSAGVVFAKYLSGTLTMGTAELEELFSEEGTTTITPTFEVEVFSGGDRKTAIQSQVTIKDQLVGTESLVPADFASYYTKAEADNKFVEDLNTGAAGSVDANNRRLRNASGNIVVDYGASLFGSGGMVDLSGSGVTIGNYPIYANTAVTITGAVSIGGATRIGGSVGFYGTSPIAKPSGANAVSNVISLGLIASSSTYGIFPGSIKTLNQIETLNFGNVSSHSSVTFDITLTGASANDIVLIGLPTAVCEGLGFRANVSTTNEVIVEAYNSTTSDITQSSQDFRIVVIGY